MKNILKLYNFSIYTYFFISICFVCGYIKEIFIIMIIIMFHEFGHALASKYFNYDIISIDIYPFGGITKVNKKINCPIKNDIIIYMGGIRMQLFLQIIIICLFKINIISFSIYKLFILYNKIIIIFNLFIIYPLDGFLVMSRVLEKHIPFYFSKIIMGIISVIFLALFIFNNDFLFSNLTITLFLVYQLIFYCYNINNIFNRFLLERYLYNISYSKIKYNKKEDIRLLRKECYHFFSSQRDLISEKEILAKKFDINQGF